jgi:hypothetical protein
VSSSWRFQYTLAKLKSVLHAEIGRRITGITGDTVVGSHSRRTGYIYKSLIERVPRCIYPAVSAQLKLLRRMPRQGFACSAPDEGFGVIAKQQGAKAVLATLWPVADQSTAILMADMYRRRQQSQSTKIEALRQAQVSLAANPKTSQPLF